MVTGETGPPFRVEPRQAEDLPACVDLLHAVHVADAYPVLWPSDPIRWLVGKRELAAGVARDAASSIQGHVALHRVVEGPASDLWTRAAGIGQERLVALSRLIVSPTYRRQRLGEALANAATRYVHELGARPVLDVAQDSVAAIRFYECLGWRRVGEWELTFDGDRHLPLFAYLGPAAP